MPWSAAWETIPIPDPAVKDEQEYYETRCIIRAVVELEDRDVCLLVTHMGLNLGEKRTAVETLCGLSDECELPLIVMGDFNAKPEHEVIKPLLARLKDSTAMDVRPNAPTFPSDAPDRKLDYILYRGLRCLKAGTCDWRYSDHLPLMAEFEHL